MDPFHVVSGSPGTGWIGVGNGFSRPRPGTQGRAGSPLYRARQTLHTGADLLTEKQQDRLTTLFTVEDHLEVEAAWGIYQRIGAAYRHRDKKEGTLEQNADC